MGIKGIKGQKGKERKAQRDKGAKRQETGDKLKK